VLAPGFRLAWVIASEEIINKFALTKQCSDLCSNMFVQYIAYEYIKGGYLDTQIQYIKQLYRHKRDVMIKALEDYFPKGAKWTIPGGGMFLWVTFPKNVNTRLMFKRAVAKKVAYVVGDAFYPDSSNYNSMRLNFSYSDDNVIIEGIKRLAEVIKEEMATPYDKDEYVGGV
jgi:2-aminoadipate transaminase